MDEFEKTVGAVARLVEARERVADEALVDYLVMVEGMVKDEEGSETKMTWVVCGTVPQYRLWSL